MGEYRHFEVKPLSGAVGAVLHGIDISHDLADDQIAEIREALLEYLVIFFRDQRMSDERLMTFGRYFGELYLHPNLAKRGPYPEVIHVVKEPEATRVVGAEWHTDTGHVECPPMGGDTIWVNMAQAYAGLPDDVKARIEGLEAVHDLMPGFGARMSAEERLVNREKFPPATHPVVRTHPESGEKILYVNAFTTHFTNYHTPARVRFGQDGNPGATDLLRYLISQAYIPEYQVRWRWQPNSVAIWDNTATQHYAVMDYPPCYRKMERAGIIGSVPF